MNKNVIYRLLGIVNLLIVMINLPTCGLFVYGAINARQIESFFTLLIALGLIGLAVSGVLLLHLKRKGLYLAALSCVLWVVPIYAAIAESAIRKPALTFLAIAERDSVILDFIPVITYTSAGSLFFVLYFLLLLAILGRDGDLNTLSRQNRGPAVK